MSCPAPVAELVAVLTQRGFAFRWEPVTVKTSTA